MKKLILFSLFLLAISQVFSDWHITRGPNPGEIYFYGPTSNGEGLYYSTDYGMTAVCVDPTISQSFITITADKTPGLIYYSTMGEALYISNNYGNTGSWQFVNGGISIYINSGVTDGFIYNAIMSHSEDYGNSFIQHEYNGLLGSMMDSEIDNQSNIGYAMVNKLEVVDSLFLLFTSDNFNNLELIYSFKSDYGFSSGVRLSRGANWGELFFYNKFDGSLNITQDYGVSWLKTNDFNDYDSDLFSSDFIGGNNQGEIYLMYRYNSMMGQIAHTYIFYSVDYGISYEVFHPFSKGQEPLLANFSGKTENTSTDDNPILSFFDSVYYPIGEIPMSVQFNNYSIGNIQNIEWDFDNDAIIDSYEENPLWIYQDTGFYSVKLTIYDEFGTNSFLRDSYVYAYKTTGTRHNFQNVKIELSCYPNPFTQNTNLRFNTTKPTNLNIKVYDITGKETNFNKTIEVTEGEQSINLELEFLPPGVYYISLCGNGERIGVKKVVIR